jgi:HD superfamily phosphohydrolase
MLVKALELAKDDLGLLDFDRPEEYLLMDDYRVWTRLRECKKSKDIMEDIEARRLIKSCYERTVFTREEVVSNVISKDSVRDNIQQDIAKKAKVPIDTVIIDVPTLPSVPYHHAVEIQPMDIPVFHRASNKGKKEPVQLSEISRIIGVLRTFMNLVRVYTLYKYRARVETAAREILGDSPATDKIQT